jgi:hypothetical protein
MHLILSKHGNVCMLCWLLALAAAASCKGVQFQVMLPAALVGGQW